MNKRRLAVFVEGQTELIFVREFLKQILKRPLSILLWSWAESMVWLEDNTTSTCLTLKPLCLFLLLMISAS